jgi:hypothetical protein
MGLPLHFPLVCQVVNKPFACVGAPRAAAGLSRTYWTQDPSFKSHLAHGSRCCLLYCGIAEERFGQSEMDSSTSHVFFFNSFISNQNYSDSIS